MYISDSKKITTIQSEFSQLYPHLQLKFYKKAHAVHKSSSPKEEWNSDLTLAEIRSNSLDGELKISDDMKTQALEMAFENHFGLHVQLFRESTGGVWLQTTTTDDWTIAAQNQHAQDSISSK